MALLKFLAIHKFTLMNETVLFLFNKLGIEVSLTTIAMRYTATKPA